MSISEPHNLIFESAQNNHFAVAPLH